MVQFNGATGEINIKIVYLSASQGAAMASLEMVKRKLPEGNAGEIVSINTEEGQTLFFNFLPVSLGTVGSHVVNLKLYAAPEATYYSASRKIVTEGADGFIFIADTRRAHARQNAELLKDMIQHMRQNGVVPVVFQWDYISTANRQPEELFAPEEMNAMFNANNLPAYAVTTYEEVLNILKQAVKAIVAHI